MVLNLYHIVKYFIVYNGKALTYVIIPFDLKYLLFLLI